MEIASPHLAGTVLNTDEAAALRVLRLAKPFEAKQSVRLPGQPNLSGVGFRDFHPNQRFSQGGFAGNQRQGVSCASKAHKGVCERKALFYPRRMSDVD